MNKEPAIGVGATLSAILYAVVFILEGQGIQIADKTQDGVEMLIYALCAVPAISGLITRFLVFSPNKTQELVDVAYLAEPPATVPVGRPAPTPDVTLTTTPQQLRGQVRQLQRQ